MNTIHSNKHRLPSYLVHVFVCSVILCEVVDPHDPETICAIDPNYRIVRRRNDGVSWESVTSLSSSIQTLAPGPQRTGIQYTGTLTGVFRSIDSGVTWQSISNGLPTGNLHPSL